MRKIYKLRLFIHFIRLRTLFIPQTKRSSYILINILLFLVLLDILILIVRALLLLGRPITLIIDFFLNLICFFISVWFRLIFTFNVVTPKVPRVNFPINFVLKSGFRTCPFVQHRSFFLIISTFNDFLLSVFLIFLFHSLFRSIVIRLIMHVKRSLFKFLL